MTSLERMMNVRWIKNIGKVFKQVLMDIPKKNLDMVVVIIVLLIIRKKGNLEQQLLNFMESNGQIFED